MRTSEALSSWPAMAMFLDCPQTPRLVRLVPRTPAVSTNPAGWYPVKSLPETPADWPVTLELSPETPMVTPVVPYALPVIEYAGPGLVPAVPTISERIPQLI